MDPPLVLHYSITPIVSPALSLACVSLIITDMITLRHNSHLPRQNKRVLFWKYGLRYIQQIFNVVNYLEKQAYILSLNVLLIAVAVVLNHLPLALSLRLQ